MRAHDEVPFRSVLVAHEHHMKTDLSGYPRTDPAPSARASSPGSLRWPTGSMPPPLGAAYQTVPIEPDQVLREMWQNPQTRATTRCW